MPRYVMCPPPLGLASALALALVGSPSALASAPEAAVCTHPLAGTLVLAPHPALLHWLPSAPAPHEARPVPGQLLRLTLPLGPLPSSAIPHGPQLPQFPLRASVSSPQYTVCELPAWPVWHCLAFIASWRNATICWPSNQMLCFVPRASGVSIVESSSFCSGWWPCLAFFFFLFLFFLSSSPWLGL
jgi:hypothetical protein